MSPTPLIVPPKEISVPQFAFTNKAQSVVAISSNERVANTSLGLFGTGKVPISHTMDPVAPKLGL